MNLLVLFLFIKIEEVNLLVVVMPSIKYCYVFGTSCPLLDNGGYD